MLWFELSWNHKTILSWKGPTGINSNSWFLTLISMEMSASIIAPSVNSVKSSQSLAHSTVEVSGG